MNERDDYIGKLYALNREEIATIAWDLLQRKNDLRAQLAEAQERIAGYVEFRDEVGKYVDKIEKRVGGLEDTDSQLIAMYEFTKAQYDIKKPNSNRRGSV